MALTELGTAILQVRAELLQMSPQDRLAWIAELGFCTGCGKTKEENCWCGYED